MNELYGAAFCSNTCNIRLITLLKLSRSILRHVNLSFNLTEAQYNRS